MEEVTKILLNGISIPNFIAFYIMGVAGAIVSLGFSVESGIRKNTTTPNKFSWGALKVKTGRIIIAAITIALGIIFNKEILSFMFSSEAPVELTLWSSLIVGMGWDRLGKTLTTKK